MKSYTVNVTDTSTEWYLDGKRHREGGPAFERADGYKAWWVDGKIHRLNGPAIERANGFKAFKAWWFNGKRHRLDGPAVEYANGDKEWWVDDKKMTEKEFNEYIKPKPSCEGKVVEVDGVKYRLVMA
jgi:hypothetical protein